MPDEPSFPMATFVLVTLMLGAFLFTSGNLESYKNIFAFFPSEITPYSLITYTFIHVDFFHLAINLIFLFIAGMSLEKRVGGLKFLGIYVISALFTVLFDLLGRYIIGISPSVPLVGSSGAVFGLLAVASFINPSGKVPVGVVFATFLSYFGLFPALGILSNPIFLVFITTVLVIITSYIFPINLPLGLSTLTLLFNWIVSILTGYPTDVSNVGHLGGFVGGIASIFFLAENAKYYK